MRTYIFNIFNSTCKSVCNLLKQEGNYLILCFKYQLDNENHSLYDKFLHFN